VGGNLNGLRRKKKVIQDVKKTESDIGVGRRGGVTLRLQEGQGGRVNVGILKKKKRRERDRTDI